MPALTRLALALCVSRGGTVLPELGCDERWESMPEIGARASARRRDRWHRDQYSTSPYSPGTATSVPYEVPTSSLRKSPAPNPTRLGHNYGWKSTRRALDGLAARHNGRVVHTLAVGGVRGLVQQAVVDGVELCALPVDLHGILLRE